jgi:hypothetical protein
MVDFRNYQTVTGVGAHIRSELGRPVAESENDAAQLPQKTPEKVCTKSATFWSWTPGSTAAPAICITAPRALKCPIR